LVLDNTWSNCTRNVVQFLNLKDDPEAIKSLTQNLIAELQKKVQTELSSWEPGVGKFPLESFLKYVTTRIFNRF
jgi:hypothetical protein